MQEAGQRENADDNHNEHGVRARPRILGCLSVTIYCVLAYVYCKKESFRSKLVNSRLKWAGHVERMKEEWLTKRADALTVDGKSRSRKEICWDWEWSGERKMGSGDGSEVDISLTNDIEQRVEQYHISNIIYHGTHNITHGQNYIGVLKS